MLYLALLTSTATVSSTSPPSTSPESDWRHSSRTSAAFPPQRHQYPIARHALQPCARILPDPQDQLPAAVMCFAAPEPYLTIWRYLVRRPVFGRRSRGGCSRCEHLLPPPCALVGVLSIASPLGVDIWVGGHGAEVDVNKVVEVDVTFSGRPPLSAQLTTFGHFGARSVTLLSSVARSLK